MVSVLGCLNEMSKELFGIWAHDDITNEKFNRVTPLQIQNDVFVIKKDVRGKLLIDGHYIGV